MDIILYDCVDDVDDYVDDDGGDDAIEDHFQGNWFVSMLCTEECIHCLKAWVSPLDRRR